MLSSRTLILASMGFMVVAIMANGYADAFPEYAKFLASTGTVATGIAALFMHPPVPPGAP